MANNGYSVDDILEEIRRKKQKETSEETHFTGAETIKKQSESNSDFFEMREKKDAQPAQKKEEAPTYTKKFNSEPITTRTIQVDDTLSQYFGPTEWKNGKKPKEKKDGFASKVNTVPAHGTKKDPEPKKENINGFLQKEGSPRFEGSNIERPEKGFEHSVAVLEQKPKSIPEEKKAEDVVPEQKINRESELGGEKRFYTGIHGFGEIKTPPEEPTREEYLNEHRSAEGLTASTNRDLYKEFTEKRRDKVEEFMRQVVEPTDQEIGIPEVPAAEPVVNKFSEKANSEIAKELMSEMHEPDDNDPEDYEDSSQKEAVEKNLGTQRLSLIIRSVVLFVLFVLSLVLCLSPVLGYQLPEAIAFSKSGMGFPIINLVIVCVAALACHVTVGGGLLSLVRFRAGNDTFAACSIIGAAALGVSFVIDPSAMSSGGENLFFPIMILGLFFNTLGKLFSAIRIKNNFEVLVSEGQKSALLPVHNRELARELTGQRDEIPRFCTSAKTKFFTRFLELSYRDDATESIARIVSPIVFFCSIIVGVIAFFLTGKVSDAIVGFAAILCVATPFSATIAGALPVYRSCKALNEQGSVMAGGYTAETFAETDSVLLDIEQLFPDGSIILHGIKTFAQGRIDEAILDAASVICSTKSTIGSIFLNVVQGDRKLLKPVDSIIYEDGMGLSAWVGGKRVLIGNRELMINHGVDIPSHDYENKYVGVGKDILYLANSGELTAMFVLSYHADKEVYRSLGIMAERGVRLVINCSDPNITTEKLSELFGYPESQLKLLSSKYQQKCAELTEERDKAPAAAVYDGSLSALSDLLNCCGIIRQSSFAAALLEMIGIILGFVLVTFFLFSGNISSLGMYVLLGFQLFWIAAVSVVIMSRKKI